MKEIIFFSNNENKIIEICSLLKTSAFNILNLRDFDKIKSPAETGNSFNENAKIKSLFGLNKFNKMCFADDSGICIEAMGGGPGINSSDFLNSKKKTNVLNYIINITQSKNNFNAYFQTTVCLAINKNSFFYFTGKIMGKISNNIKGVNGFGYDPIFIPSGYSITFAEMDIFEKNKISHRSIALSKLKKYLLSI
jgi:XTP/dITP diphosphohydrolase